MLCLRISAHQHLEKTIDYSSHMKAKHVILSKLFYVPTNRKSTGHLESIPAHQQTAFRGAIFACMSFKLNSVSERF